jgi:HD-GYP domain-containing protein (c-di-GMP phosphodiesterase class II)
MAGIIAAMEARDAYTASHSMRVSDMTEIICGLLDLSEEQAEDIHIAAHVHDIGKIGIEDSILRKNSPLDEMEWLSIKQHPIIGFNILNKVSCFDSIAEIVRHHHERWDGKGYPDGIRENEIPFGSRIIAIADSIDAMMSNRQYRKSLSSLQCKEEIHKNSGIMYDPVIAEIVLKNWETIVDEITF